MDKKLEIYMYRKMIIEQYGAATYQSAHESIKAIHGYSDMNWFRQIMFSMQLSNCHSDLFKSLKIVQSDLIDAIIKSKKGSQFTRKSSQ